MHSGDAMIEFSSFCNRRIRSDLRHKRVESVLVVHVEAVAPKPCEEPEHPPRIAIGAGPVAAALWALTAASIRLSRSPASPRVGTSTSIGLTMLPIADPPPASDRKPAQ
jgi:hypothetical protein